MLIVAVVLGFSLLVWWASQHGGRWREVAAFAVAPLTPCVVLGSFEGDLRWALVLMPFSYFFVIVATPVYLLLRRHGWVGLWQLLAVGTVLGVLVCLVIGASITTIRDATLYGGIGTLTALTFWSVAFLQLRPDKTLERTHGE